MIVVVWILLSTVPGRLCSDLRDKRLLLNDQTVVHETIQQLQVEVQQLKTEVTQLKQSQSASSSYTSYIRWGRHSCPASSTLTYRGFAGGHPYNETGSGVNFLCLPDDPLWGIHRDDFNSYSGWITGVEYEGGYFFGSGTRNYDVPCAVCLTPYSTSIMIPARNVCYDGWHMEYSGYLMSNAHRHIGESEYLCVDEKPDIIPNSQSNTDGAVLYMVESVCRSLSCPPYVAGRELTCVVCSK
ncbi:short-chain collagen C4-like isoform X2 [Ostrea edulis]|uniref:short-chain collagen C4-like isoform X2 n=1 Tax=Ostrea edulis TaxID=37623 RepID=UPI0024AEB1AD|nr:short-chain collagen C4-like isoform X2 [Ostrea edulis]